MQHANKIPQTSFAQSDSAFCLRRISTSTWLRACLSLTSRAPRSVSALVSTSLHAFSSCSSLSHLRRLSSKFMANWMNSDNEKTKKGSEYFVGERMKRWINTALYAFYFKYSNHSQYSRGSMLSLRTSACARRLSKTLWRFITAVSMFSCIVEKKKTL